MFFCILYFFKKIFLFLLASPYHMFYLLSNHNSICLSVSRWQQHKVIIDVDHWHVKGRDLIDAK